MRDKKVLIITYYWPPSGGSGVQRWLKFVKYLPQFGWEPYVFTPEKPFFHIKDDSLLKDVPPEAEVIHFPIWEPYAAFHKLSKLSGSEVQVASPQSNKSFFAKVSTWIRGNFFIPDPRVFWVRPSVRFLEDFIRDNKIRIIITTGPPHSVHLIGLRLKQKDSTLRWLADFRDPWSEWGLLDSLRVGSFARWMHKRLEGKVLRSADRILTITPFYVKQFQKLSGRKVQLLTNGFDADDFRDLVYKPSEKFMIRHVGIVNEKCNPRPFMNALGQLMLADSDFAQHVAVEFIGEVHPDFKAFLRASEILQTVTRFTGNIPHQQLIATYGESSLLLLILTGYKDAEGYMPGKLFEYLATGLPVLGVGPVRGDAALLMKESGVGEMVAEDDSFRLKEIVLRHFSNWKQHNGLRAEKNLSSPYSRESLTNQLAGILEELR
ncbi:MAG: glycosyl transferase [Cyclobacteriaceae bacterium]|nr:glycosyl transferase [Cyclobacteriaceae bacterium]